MSMKTFDPFRPPAGRRAGSKPLQLVAPAPVTDQRSSDSIAQAGLVLEPLAEPGHKPCGLEPAGSFDQHRAREPEQSRKRRTVVEAGGGLADQWEFPGG